MSNTLIAHSPDLQKLRNEGYKIEIKNTHLLVHKIPYATSERKVARGVLVSPLGALAGNKTAKPENHMMYFIGEHPCDNNGNVITGIQHPGGGVTLAEGVVVNHTFSNKPAEDFPDYYEKVTNYERIISSYAKAIDPSVKAQVFDVVTTEDDPEIVFNYLDANSARAEIQAMSEKLQNLRLAIIGLGGTGSYVLDFVAKTPVKEIHLFDADTFISHNAFRAPGAASAEILEAQKKKVSYLHDVYSKMHKYIIPHEYFLTDDNVEELTEMDFVFICIDDATSKKSITNKLVGASIPFVDVGIGIDVIDGLLDGTARVTTGTSEKNDHLDQRISFVNGTEDAYNKNIQIAEINALNAALAVIKWKKLCGFYHDLTKEHHSSYGISTNKLINDEAHA